MHATPILILETIVGFSFLVLIHELGHFLAAKWAGVRVEAFSLGFGPALKKKWGQTEYRLSAIPLGGYVKLAGEEPQEGKTPAPDEFYGKPVGKRAVVFAAGAFMNIVFGYLIFTAAYAVGVDVAPTVVGSVEPGSPAWHAGLQRGDVIEGIEGISPPVDFEDLRVAVTLSGAGEAVGLDVRREDRTFRVDLYPEFNRELGMRTGGIYQMVYPRLAEAPSDLRAPKAVEPDAGALYRAGMRQGDTIIAVQTAAAEAPKPVTRPDDFAEALEDCAGKPITIFFTRDGVAQPPIIVPPRQVGKPTWIGVRFGSNALLAARRGSWAETVDLRENDRIIAVDGVPTMTDAQVFAALDAAPDRTLPVKVRRGGETLDMSFPARSEDGPAERDLAFKPGLVVAKAWPDYPAARAGIQPGDTFVSANGRELESGVDLHEVIADTDGKPVMLTWLRDGRTMSATVAPQRLWHIVAPFEQARTVIRAPFGGALVLGTRKATQWIFRIYGTLRSLITGGVSARHLSGPIGIGYLTYKAASRGLGMFLYILALLSVNLGVVNLLPIPIFDGGHLVFALLEKIRGRTVSERIRNFANYVGLALILTLVAVTFWNDIWRLVFG